MMKTRRFKTKKQFKEYLNKAINRQKLFHNKIIRYLGFTSEYSKAGKFVDFIIRRFYDYHKYSLKDIIEIKIKNYQNFS